MDNKELNKKLAEWAGFVRVEKPPVAGMVLCEWKWPEPEGYNFVIPDFTQSLDACFEWLWRKTIKILADTEREGCEKLLGLWLEEPGSPLTPLALCLAIEKLIDSEVK